MDNEKEFEVVSVFNKLCLLSNKRVETLPEGFYKYDLRHGEDWGVPKLIEKYVGINWFGSIICDEPIDIDFDQHVIKLVIDDNTFDYDEMINDGDASDQVYCTLDEFIKGTFPHDDSYSKDWFIPEGRLVKMEDNEQ